MSNGQIADAPHEFDAASPERAEGEFAAKTDAPHGVRANNLRNLRLRAPVEVNASATVGEVIKLMRERASECVVIQGAEAVAGVFTECDFLTKIAGQEIDMSAPALDFVSRTISIFESTATVGEAIDSISDGCCHNIIVTENKEFAGTISDLDLITYLAESYPKETMNLPPVPNQIMDTQEGG